MNTSVHILHIFTLNRVESLINNYHQLKVTNLLTIDVCTMIIENVLFNYPLYIFHEV